MACLTFIVLIVLGASFTTTLAQAQVIDSSLLTTLSATPGGRVNVLMSFRTGTRSVLNTFTGRTFPDRAARLRAVASALRQNAATTQARALRLLAGAGGLQTNQYKSLWITNEIVAKGVTPAMVEQLAGLEGVRSIREDTQIFKPVPGLNPRPAPRPTPDASGRPRPTWSVSSAGAPRAWREGATGAGIVAGHIDTGARHTHEALRGSYRGVYAWFDPYDRTPTPNDQDGHGTHTVGVMSGQLGIGVAPGSKWISCKGCTYSNCTLSGLLECGQFMLCPHLADGSLPQCELAPHLVTNSWGGDGGQDFYEDVLRAWVTAGIVPVFAAGNDGPDCGSIASPADSELAIAVGATTQQNSLADYSASGPTITGARVKPDLVAPGVDIISAWSDSDTSYQYLDATSMACPSVAGSVALILSGAGSPGNYLSFDQVRQHLFSQAERNVSETADRDGCGGTNNAVVPNNAVGYGKVNAYGSVRSARGESASGSGSGSRPGRGRG